jgi:methionine-rich copper-binding protein CopC
MNHLLRLLACLAVFVGAGAASAHARLQSSEPANGATISAGPAVLTLRYNEAVEAAMSEVKLVGPGNVAIAVGKPAVAADDDKALRVPVQAPTKLAPGDYRIEWSTMGHDGHHTKGDVRFTVK